MSHYERERFDLTAAVGIIVPSDSTPLPWPSLAKAIEDATRRRESVKSLVDRERPLNFEAMARDLERLGDPPVAELFERLYRDANELGLSYATFTKFWAHVCRATADAHSGPSRREGVQAKNRNGRRAKAALQTLLELLQSSERVQQAAENCLDRELFNQINALWLNLLWTAPRTPTPACRGMNYVYYSQPEILRKTLVRLAAALADVKPVRPTGGHNAKVYAEHLIHEFSAAFGKPRLKDALILVKVIFGPQALSLNQLEDIRREQTRRSR